jgi:hypothetical protein
MLRRIQILYNIKNEKESMYSNLEYIYFISATPNPLPVAEAGTVGSNPTEGKDI